MSCNVDKIYNLVVALNKEILCLCVEIGGKL